jgi:hypothetical protein
MQGRKSGYFLVYRDVWKHPVFKNLIEASIWLYMISSASHKSRTLMFLDNPITVNTGELIFPIRKNAKIWNISYSSLRTFLLRLKRRKMITIRVIRTQPTPNHRFNSVSVINVCNYSRFQFNEEATNHHLTSNPALLNHYTKPFNTNISNGTLKESSKDIIYLGDEFGEYVKIKTGGKIKWKHKFKPNMPLKDEL